MVWKVASSRSPRAASETPCGGALELKARSVCSKSERSLMSVYLLKTIVQHHHTQVSTQASHSCGKPAKLLLSTYLMLGQLLRSACAATGYDEEKRRPRHKSSDACMYVSPGSTIAALNDRRYLEQTMDHTHQPCQQSCKLLFGFVPCDAVDNQRVRGQSMRVVQNGLEQLDALRRV